MHSDLQELSQKILNYSINKALTISCAESCSGGLLAAALTYHSGSSQFFKSGLVTYSNEAKEKFLAISAELIEKAGAVSEEVAFLMAKNCKEQCGTTLSVSITGIAGPEGDNKTDQVGLVYIGLSGANTTIVRKFLFKGERETIRRQAVVSALEFLIGQFEII